MEHKFASPFFTKKLRKRFSKFCREFSGFMAAIQVSEVFSVRVTCFIA